MTNWIEVDVVARIVPEDEVTRLSRELRCSSEVLGVVLYELGCLDDNQQEPIRKELGVDIDLAIKWLKLYVNEEFDGDSAPFWQSPTEAAAKLRALAGIFETRGPAAHHLWQLSLEGVFGGLMPRAVRLRIDTDRPSPGCSSGDWACHLAYCLKANAGLMDALTRQGETEVLLTFAPFM